MTQLHVTVLSQLQSPNNLFASYMSCMILRTNVQDANRIDSFLHTFRQQRYSRPSNERFSTHACAMRRRKWRGLGKLTVKLPFTETNLSAYTLQLSRISEGDSTQPRMMYTSVVFMRFGCDATVQSELFERSMYQSDIFWNNLLTSISVLPC